MGEGRDKPIKECHSFEVVVDKDAELLVVGQTTQEGPITLACNLDRGRTSL